MKFGITRHSIFKNKKDGVIATMNDIKEIEIIVDDYSKKIIKINNKFKINFIKFLFQMCIFLLGTHTFKSMRELITYVSLFLLTTTLIEYFSLLGLTKSYIRELKNLECHIEYNFEKYKNVGFLKLKIKQQIYRLETGRK